MKLTKSQRLFIKAGEAQGLMKKYSNLGHFKAQHRKERKKLIREALEAAEAECARMNAEYRKEQSNG
jgi:hypothetical protein